MSVPVPSADALWQWLPIGYALTVALEAPVLVFGLPAKGASQARGYTLGERLTAAVWLTGVTYPIVVVALPLVLWPRTSYAAYVVVAEAFAITAECLLFRRVWQGTRRDLVVIALANLISATAGALMATYGLWDFDPSMQ